MFSSRLASPVHIHHHNPDPKKSASHIVRSKLRANLRAISGTSRKFSCDFRHFAQIFVRFQELRANLRAISGHFAQLFGDFRNFAQLFERLRATSRKPSSDSGRLRATLRATPSAFSHKPSSDSERLRATSRKPSHKTSHEKNVLVKIIMRGRLVVIFCIFLFLIIYLKVRNENRNGVTFGSIDSFTEPIDIQTKTDKIVSNNKVYYCTLRNIETLTPTLTFSYIHTYDYPKITPIFSSSRSTALTNSVYLFRTNHDDTMIVSGLIESGYVLEQDSVQILSLKDTASTTKAIFLKTDGKLYNNYNNELPLEFVNFNESVMQIDYCGNANKFWILSNYHKVYQCSIDGNSIIIENTYNGLCGSININNTIVTIRGDVTNSSYPMAITSQGMLLLSEAHCVSYTGEHVVDLVRDNNDYVYTTSSDADGTRVFKYYYNQEEISLANKQVSRVFALSGKYIFANTINTSTSNESFEIIEVDDSGFTTIFNVLDIQHYFGNTISVVAILNSSVTDIIFSVIAGPIDCSTFSFTSPAFKASSTFDSCDQVECLADYVRDPLDSSSCSNCPYYQKRQYGVNASDCTPLNCKFTLSSSPCSSTPPGTMCDTDVIPNYSDITPIDIRTDGFSSILHQGTGLAFVPDTSSSYDPCVGYVYSSNETNTALIRYPGISNVTLDIIPESAHIHYNHVCFENSNISEVKCPSSTMTGIENATKDNEPDPHCENMYHVSDDGTHKQCVSNSCGLDFKANNSAVCPFGICHQIISSDISSTNSQSPNSQHSVSSSGITHDWNVRGRFDNASGLNNIQLVSRNTTEAAKCGVFGYSYPDFSQLRNSNQKLDNSVANSWGSNVVIPAGGYFYEVGGDLGKYLSSVCFYDPSRPDSSNMCAHTSTPNIGKVNMGGMPACQQGYAPTGVDGLCVQIPVPVSFSLKRSRPKTCSSHNDCKVFLNGQHKHDIGRYKKLGQEGCAGTVYAKYERQYECQWNRCQSKIKVKNWCGSEPNWSGGEWEGTNPYPDTANKSDLPKIESGVFGQEYQTCSVDALNLEEAKNKCSSGQGTSAWKNFIDDNINYSGDMNALHFPWPQEHVFWTNGSMTDWTEGSTITHRYCGSCGERK